MSPSHRCGGILSHSSLQNGFNSATLEDFQAWKDCFKVTPQHHHVWLLVWCSSWWMLCWFYARCNGTSHLTNVKLVSISPQKYLPTQSWDNQDIVGKCGDEPLCSCWSAVAYSLDLSHGCCFCSVSFLLLNHEHILIEASEACSSLDVVLGSFSFGVNFGKMTAPGKVPRSKFSPCVDNVSDRGSLESQSLRNVFLTLSRLIHVNYFVSHLFLKFFRSWHDVFLFKHASLCQTGSV